MVSGFEFGGKVGQSAVAGMKFNGRGLKFIGYRDPRRFTVAAPDNILHLGVIDFGHVNGLIALTRLFENKRDRICARFIEQQFEQGVTIKDGRSGHVWLPPIGFRPAYAPPTLSQTASRRASSLAHPATGARSRR
jgi:hypothetical protein